MDEIDKKITLLLQEDARMTITEMTDHLHLSRPSVTERLKRLQDAGIIEKYTARISLDIIGKSIQAFLRIENLKDSMQKIWGENIRRTKDSWMPPSNRWK